MAISRYAESIFNSVQNELEYERNLKLLVEKNARGNTDKL